MTQLTHSTPTAADDRRLAEDLYGFLGVIRRGWRYIAVSTLVCVTIAVFYAARAKPVYKGSARLLILQQGGRPLSDVVANGRDPFQYGDFNDYIPTHMLVIRSPAIVSQAIELSGLKHLRIADVIKRLTVIRPEQVAKILEIGYQADTSDEATKIVASVVESYKRFLEENYQEKTNDVIRLISKVRDDLSAELKELEHKYLEFRKQHPSLTVTEDGRSLLARRAEQWDAEENKAVLKEARIRTQLELGQMLSEEGEGLWAISNAMKILGGVEIQTGEGAGDALAGSLDQVVAQWEDTQIRRGTAEKILEHLRAEFAAAAANRQVSDEEVAEAFYAEPEAARIREQIRLAQGKLDTAQRVVRSASDPTITHAQKRMQALQDQLADLWKRRRAALRELLVRDAGAEIDAATRRTETEVLVLRAQESALRERVEQLKAEDARRKGQVRLAGTDAGAPPGTVGAPEPAEAAATRGALGRPGAGPVQALLESLRRGLEANERLRLNMRRRFEADIAKAQETEIELLTAANIKAELERQRTMFFSVVEQLKQARLVSDYTSITAQTVNPPDATAARPRLVIILAASLVIGFGLGLGLAFLADLLDARLRTLPEIRKALDLSVLGLIPQLTRERDLDSGPIATLSHIKPRSIVAESYKAIRTNIEFYRRSRRVQVLLITSPHSGDGKSTSASNLAISLALAGRKVLLVDADLRRPSQHLLYNLSRDHGLVHVLKNLLPLSGAVQPTFVENLNLLSAGPDATNPAELLASHQFGEFLETARQSYDMVIIDSSPLLAVTDPSIIGAAVDGIVLVVRATSLKRHEAERTTELLRSLGTPVLGTVINGITREQTGYGYGYGYGHGYGYGTYGSSGSSRSLEEPTTTAQPERSNGSVDHEITN